MPSQLQLGLRRSSTVALSGTVTNMDSGPPPLWHLNTTHTERGVHKPSTLLLEDWCLEKVGVIHNDMSQVWHDAKESTDSLSVFEK